MIQQQANLRGFNVSVQITAPTPASASRFERFVMTLGQPGQITKACDHLAAATCAGAVVYIVAWLFWLRGVAQATFNPTPGQAIILSLAWTPFMVFHLLLGGVRYAVISLQMKNAQQAAEAASFEFFQAITMAVNDAVENHTRQGDPEKPTIQ